MRGQLRFQVEICQRLRRLIALIFLSLDLENQDWLIIARFLRLGKGKLWTRTSILMLHPDALSVPALTQNETSFLLSQNDLGHYILGTGVEPCRTTFWICGGHYSVSAPQLFVIVPARPHADQCLDF